MIRGPETGWASGWSVWECSWLADRWQWSASGPNGMTMGGALTKEDAERRAQAAMESLKVDVRPRGIG